MAGHFVNPTTTAVTLTAVAEEWPALTWLHHSQAEHVALASQALQ